MNESPFPPESVESQIVDVIKTCYDPEIPVNIFELGLIYEIAFNEGVAKVMMTLTSPMCPVAESLPPEVQEAPRAIGEAALPRPEEVRHRDRQVQVPEPRQGRAVFPSRAALQKLRRLFQAVNAEFSAKRSAL